MKALRFLSVAVLVTAALAPDVLANGRKPGSALVYPNQYSVGGLFSIVSVTNTNTDPLFLSNPGGSTNARFEYANAAFTDPNNPFIATNCSIVDPLEFLSPADTLSVLTFCHNGGGNRGYLVISAENTLVSKEKWSHNALIGSAIIINGTGLIYSVNAIPFNAGAPFHTKTDSNGNGRMDFDTTEYEKISDVHYADSVIPALAPSLTLINLTGGVFARNTVHLDIWDDNERANSINFQIGCWYERNLFEIHNWFLPGVLALNSGDDDTELDLNCDNVEELETLWFRIESVGVNLLGGVVVSTDGALLGAISAGGPTVRSPLGGKLLWESNDVQANGVFLEP